ncbi:hypothetical protein [Pseudomonas sp. BBP2017]|uniref:hypothetical protein n=1 Tax=Pseudomonas sp. BBP2017 TaxID=2109731 RepID=UPI000D11F00C|nr:hypothetical protein [Pseudomonas sp. BBP2017]PSS58944.1 hypothetical protein C6382_00815 [Pseudomonas sp. BBP2017]
MAIEPARLLYPLTDFVDRSQVILSDFLHDVADEVFDEIMVANAWTDLGPDGFTLDAEFYLDGLGELSLPGLGQFALSFDPWQAAHGTLVCGPEPSLTIEQIGVTLRFDPSILAKADDPAKGAVIRSTCWLRFDRDGFHFESFTEADLEKARIAGTEAEIELTGIALADQGEDLFSVRKASLTLPMFARGQDKLTLEAEKLAFGRYGPSGLFRLADGTPIDFSIYDFDCELSRAGIELRRGQLVGVEIGGRLDLGAFLDDGRADGWVDVDFSLGPKGVVASLSDDEPIIDMHVAQMFALTVDTIRLEQGDGEKDGTLWLSGELTPEIEGVEGSWPSFAFDEIGISSKGDLRWSRGASIATTQPFVAQWNFLRLTVTAFSLGRPEKGGLELSLSAGIEILQGIPAGASVEGLVVWKPPKGVPKIRFNGIGLTFSTPGAFAVNVKLAWDFARRALSGSGHLDIQAIDIRMDVVFEAASEDVDSERVTNLFLAAETDLVPGGIPIGTTGLSLYAISGLLAYNKAIKLEGTGPKRYYEAFKGDPSRNIKPGFADLGKWKTSKGDHALGLGVVIGTSDDGWMFSARGALLLTIPDFVLLITATAELMQERPSMADSSEGVLSAVLAVIPAEKLIRLDFGAEWKSPPLFEAGGEGGGKFHFDKPLDWEVWLGLPPDQGDPVYARAIKVGSWLVDGDFYFLLGSVRSARTGVRSRFELKAGAAGVYVELVGEIGGDATLSWRPAQFEGTLHVAAHVRLTGAGVTLGFSYEYDPQVSIARPKTVVIPIKACIKFGPKWSPVRLCLQFSFSWRDEKPPELPALMEGLTAVPRHWNPRTLSPGVMDDGRVGHVGDQENAIPLGAVHPHSELALEFGKPMLVDLVIPAGGAAVDLNEPAVPRPELIGKDSRWKQRWTLSGLQLLDLEDGKAVEIFGTFQQSVLAREGKNGPETPRPPNTQLRLLSSRRFGEDGSLSGGGVEKVPPSDCSPRRTTKRRSVSLAGLEPGFGVLPHGWRYEWIRWADPTEPLDNRYGVGMQSDDLFYIYPPEGITGFFLRHTAYQPGQPPGKRGSSSFSASFPDAVRLGQSGMLLTRICWIELVADDGRNQPAERHGSSGAEQWTRDADKWLLRPGRHYELRVVTSGHVLRDDAVHGAAQQQRTRTYSFTALRAPDWTGALDKAVAAVYPSDGERPAYRDYDLLVRFKDVYLDALYRLDKRRLAVRLRDANGQLVTAPDGSEVLLPVAWVDGEIEKSPVERWWGRARAGASACEGGLVPPSKGPTVLQIRLKDLKLKPLTPYAAEIVAVDDEYQPDMAALHSWKFTTSRYHDFREMADAPARIPALGLAQLQPAVTKDFDGLLRSFDAPVVTLAEAARMTPVRQGNSLAFVLIEAPEPLDDSSKRLVITIGGQVAEGHPNLDRTRIIAELPTPIALKGPDDVVEVVLNWSYDVEHAPSETRRTIGGTPQTAQCRWRVPLGGLF